DFGQLASRATVRVSLVRALDQLDRLELITLDALVVLGPAPRETVVAAGHAEAGGVQRAVDHLVDLAVVWESAAGLRTLGGVPEALALTSESVTSGLRPRSEPRPDDEVVAARLAELSAPARG
ncbi:hypothetical protein QO164_32705, partial [Pseudomonas aeruginosa]|uniref:hypothetical protein n=1 Tax=Pseudomonas aeruginosa TaxID=287 RepID=UPI002E8125FE